MEGHAGGGWDRADKLSVLQKLRFGVIRSLTIESLQITKRSRLGSSQESFNTADKWKSISGKMYFKVLSWESKEKERNQLWK